MNGHRLVVGYRRKQADQRGHDNAPVTFLHRAARVESYHPIEVTITNTDAAMLDQVDFAKRSFDRHGFTPDRHSPPAGLFVLGLLIIFIGITLPQDRRSRWKHP